MKSTLITALIILPSICLADQFPNVYSTGSLNVDGNSRLGANGGSTQSLTIYANTWTDGTFIIGSASSYIMGPGASGTPGPATIGVGSGAWAGGNSSSAFGYNTWAYGHYSTALGIGTKTSYGELVLGRYNDITGNSGTANTNWVDTDPVLTIGSGTADTARANAFRILKNGNIIGNGTDNRLPLQTTLPHDSSILTRVTGDSRYYSNNGQILLGQYSVGNSNAALIVGNGASQGSPLNTATIWKNGDASFTALATSGAATIGGGVTATGSLNSSGINSILPNQQLTSAGSIVTRSLGDERYYKKSDGQVIVGNWEVPDPAAAIIVGNGADANNRNNSFVVKKDGTVVISGNQGDLSMGTFN